MAPNPKSEKELLATHNRRIVYNSLKEKTHSDGDDSFGFYAEIFETTGLDEPSIINTQLQGIKSIVKNIQINDVETLGEYADQSGCYVFRDQKGNAIYVGEGDNIYKRIRTHLMATDRKSTTYEVNIEMPEKPEWVDERRKIPKRDFEGNIINKIYRKSPYMYFYTVDIYCLSGLDELFARKYLEQLLFLAEQPIHNRYTETNKAYKTFEKKMRINQEYIDFLSSGIINPLIQTLYLPTMKQLEGSEVI
ncbi:hypothetical protein AS180_10150 [Priestia veravalensis]|uniref:GIY-YIG domain-containing protein n=1 Tax=Priestia veravalensis TaxID=1414648 RepID=A0A0V8JLP5_9BACI|nr:MULTISPECIES: GIY-YIG nuclease family protein [Priestia]KSU87958.1 hypothetical protein AS180_10150 [Priestia veravalensis]SCC24354.1 GIY-YIG catalytic domain-containing protein [Priestia flexa]